MRKANELKGKRYGKLKVLARLPRRPEDKWHARWECECDCGAILPVASSALGGGQESCGCGVGRKPTHGHTRGKRWTSTYLSWMSMKNRCSGNRKGYGGDGIRVCERWNSFVNFLADMGERPPGTTIDRIDGNGHYEKDNCRWADAGTQGNNRSNNRRFDLNGESLTLAQWGKRLGVTAQCLRRRMNVLSWPLELALSTPKNGRRLAEIARRKPSTRP